MSGATQNQRERGVEGFDRNQPMTRERATAGEETLNLFDNGANSLDRVVHEMPDDAAKALSFTAKGRHQLHVWISASEYRTLCQAASDSDRSVSSLVRLLIRGLRNKR